MKKRLAARHCELRVTNIPRRCAVWKRFLLKADFGTLNRARSGVKSPPGWGLLARRLGHLPHSSVQVARAPCANGGAAAIFSCHR